MGKLSPASTIVASLAPSAVAQVSKDVARETVGSKVSSAYSLEVKMDHPDALYKTSETATFNVRLLRDGQPVAGETLSFLVLGEKFFRRSETLVSTLNAVAISIKMKRPGFTLCEVTYRPRDSGEVEVKGTAGAGTDPLELRAFSAEPSDFDDFWVAQKQELAKAPVQELERVPVTIDDPNVESSVLQFDIKVACSAEAPVSGYLTIPRGAKPNSLPIIVSYHGAGVQEARPQIDFAAQGFLCLDINAHGIPNGKPKEYYKWLYEGSLKEYYLMGNHDRDTAYFRGIYLRVIRSLEYMKSLPEWDGKNIIVTGGSQGAAQALAAAGLDPQVTYCSAAAPWLCNFNGVLEGSIPASWPGFIQMQGTEVATPYEAKALMYFDPALLAKRIKAECALSVGYLDRACPPASVYIAYNNIPGKKQIFDCPLDTHEGPSIYGHCEAALKSYLDGLKGSRLSF